jgi:hypothetical protein
MRKKKISIVLFVVTALVLFSVSGAVAGGNPPPSLSSGFQLQNRSTTDSAAVAITYYDASGAAVETDNDTISANASKSYYVPNVLGQPDGRYSVIVSSDQPLFALVNAVTASGATPNVAATHSGFSSDETGSPLYIPWVVCGYYDYNSMVAVQNAGTGDTTITVDFYQSGSSTPAQSYNFTNVSPGESVFLDMTADPYKTDLETTTSNGFFGSIMASSTGDSTPLAAVVNDTNPTGSFLRSYNAVQTSSNALYAPQVTANYYGFSSGFTLQNPNGSAATVDVTYYASGATTPTTSQTFSIEAYSAQPTYLPSVPGMPADFNGTAVISSSLPIMGIANHDHVPAGPAASYNLIPIEKASSTLYMPQIVRAYYGYESGYQLYNVGPGEVGVTVTYFNTDGTTLTTMNHTIPAYTGFTMYLGDSRGAALGTNFNGGAKVEVTSGTGDLVGIANFVSPLGGDYQQVYNAFTP